MIIFKDTEKVINKIQQQFMVKTLNILRGYILNLIKSFYKKTKKQKNIANSKLNGKILIVFPLR